jgi:hypothetical protein
MCIAISFNITLRSKFKQFLLLISQINRNSIAESILVYIDLVDSSYINLSKVLSVTLSDGGFGTANDGGNNQSAPSLAWRDPPFRPPNGGNAGSKPLHPFTRR